VDTVVEVEDGEIETGRGFDHKNRILSAAHSVFIRDGDRLRGAWLENIRWGKCGRYGSGDQGWRDQARAGFWLQNQKPSAVHSVLV
jgi:hypothetical protein